MDDDSYEDIILRPTVPQLDLEDYGEPKHLRLIAIWKRHAIDWYVDRFGLSRNDPCMCKSGRKFKKCCGAPDPRLELA